MVTHFQTNLSHYSLIFHSTSWLVAPFTNRLVSPPTNWFVTPLTNLSQHLEIYLSHLQTNLSHKQLSLQSYLQTDLSHKMLTESFCNIKPQARTMYVTPCQSNEVFTIRKQSQELIYLARNDPRLPASISLRYYVYKI